MIFVRFPNNASHANIPFSDLSLSTDIGAAVQRGPQQRAGRARPVADGAAGGHGQDRRPRGDVRQGAHGGAGQLRPPLQRHHIQQGEFILNGSPKPIVQCNLDKEH